MCGCSQTIPQERSLLDTLTGGEDIPINVNVKMDRDTLALIIVGLFFAILFALLVGGFILGFNK